MFEVDPYQLQNFQHYIEIWIEALTSAEILIWLFFIKEAF